MNNQKPNWFEIENEEEVESPTLLIYPERVDENIRRMVAMVGDPAKLRPHVKTHKLTEVATRQLTAGISKFKAATIAETEVLGRIGAKEVLLAYQPVGPNAQRFLDLMGAFPQTEFACLVDDIEVARNLSQLAVRQKTVVTVMVDLDCGQHRTGIAPGETAVEFCQALVRLPGLIFAGLHAYDGHIHTNDPAQRKAECDAAFAPVAHLRERLRHLGLPVKTLVAGGTPTFPIHASRPDVECSPGTCVLWDYSYSSQFPDLGFQHAALVLTRVISRPGGRRICLDLGHKAIASENPHPRVYFLNAPSAQTVGHSEEHMVVELDSATDCRPGDCWYGIPRHICPTVALHAQAIVVERGRAGAKWRIESRDRHLRF